MTTQRIVNLSGVGQTGNQFALIKVGDVMSKTNHRLYRQGRKYCVRLHIAPTVRGRVRVFALRNDWMIANAWKLAFQTFMNNSKEEMDVLSKNTMARWQDFRIAPGIGPGHSVLNPVLYSMATIPAPYTGTQLTAAELVDSQVTNDAGIPLTFSWGAGTGSIFSVLEEYDKMGNAQTQPASATTQAAYASLEKETTNSQIDHLSNDGNAPPYDNVTLNPAQPWVQVADIGNGTGAGQVDLGRLSTQYFDAPCGFVVVHFENGGEAFDEELTLECKPGTYKGIDAPAMGVARLKMNHYEVK